MKVDGYVVMLWYEREGNKIMKAFNFNGGKYHFHLAESICGGTRVEVCRKGDWKLLGMVLSETLLGDDDKNIFSREPDKICLRPNLSPEFVMFLQREGFMTDTGDVKIEDDVIYPVMKLNFNKIKKFSANIS